MKFAQTTLAAVALAALVASGCKVQKKYLPLVSTLSSGDAPQMIAAPANGIYLLYRNNANTPTARAQLRAGDPIGFKVDAVDTEGKPAGPAGTLSAVAGTFVVPVNPGDAFEWRHDPGSDTRNPHRRGNFLLAKP